MTAIWTLLAFGPQASPSLAALQGPDVRTVQVLGSGPAQTPSVVIGTEAPRLYRARPGTLVLIRPDGYIAVRTGDPGIVTGYLKDIVPPRAGMMIANEHSVATP